MEDSDFFIPGGLLESMGADDFGGDDAMMLSMEGVNPRAKEFTPTLPSATPSKTPLGPSSSIPSSEHTRSSDALASTLSALSWSATCGPTSPSATALARAP